MSTLAEQIAWLDKAAGQNRKMVKACLDHNEVPSMWQAELDVLEGILASLHSLESAERDARRYRWLREQKMAYPFIEGGIFVCMQHLDKSSEYFKMNGVDIRGDALDAAVDSAMVQK